MLPFLTSIHSVGTQVVFTILGTSEVGLGKKRGGKVLL